MVWLDAMGAAWSVSKGEENTTRVVVANHDDAPLHSPIYSRTAIAAVRSLLTGQVFPAVPRDGVWQATISVLAYEVDVFSLLPISGGQH